MQKELEINLTPLMKQYQEIKANYKDTLILFRLGDFYELFGEDAIKSSPILGVVLTKRQNVPMCGVPFHSINHYLSKLLSKGFKVAICEQTEDPKTAKGLVKREVVRIITPGTVLEQNLLEPKKNNYLCAIKIFAIKGETYYGIATVDISTGDFLITQFKDEKNEKIINEITKINPSEIIISENDKEKLKFIREFFKNIHIEIIEDYHFNALTAQEKLIEIYQVKSLESFGIDQLAHNISLASCAAILEYLSRTQKNALPKLKKIVFYSVDNYMLLDNTCVRNLEILENFYDRTQKNTLLDILDETSTSFGGRLLRKWILKPLLNIQQINKRQNFVELFYEDDAIRKEIIDNLRLINDIERIVNRIYTKTANPKEILALASSLTVIPKIVNLIKKCIETSRLISQEYEELTNLPNLQNVIEMITKTINPDAPVDIKKGNIIKLNISKELDELRSLSQNTKKLLLEFQEKEKQKLGIPTLKVSYTSVFGYYIEITNSYLDKVPSHYIRKQTLKNAERFITEELKQFENKILSADEKILKLEELIYTELLNNLSNYCSELYSLAQKLAKIDIYCCFAQISRKYNYSRPKVDDSLKIELKDSRHPVLERILPTGKFIPNDVYLDGNEFQIILITGPNMAGKSTYIRQVALNIIMAQIGCFIPAKQAHIGIVDRIFARIGASDYIVKGSSTFMVEMQETANILNNCTERSLIILDEIGRGTSTYDGISIAWASIEYLANKKTLLNYGPKTLFATHYFELTELETKYQNIKNYNVSAKEFKDQILFLYKIERGSSDKSYGIHVAQIAGIPKEVIYRAKQLLSYFEQNIVNSNVSTKKDSYHLDLTTKQNNTNIFFVEILEDLKKFDINYSTPIDAFNKIIEWKKILETNTPQKKEDTQE